MLVKSAVSAFLLFVLSGCDLDPLEYCAGLSLEDQKECIDEFENVPTRYTPPEELLANLAYIRTKLLRAQQEDERRKFQPLDSPATTEEDVSPRESPIGRPRTASNPIEVKRPKGFFLDSPAKMSGKFSPEGFTFLKHYERVQSSDNSDSFVFEHRPEDSNSQEELLKGTESLPSAEETESEIPSSYEDILIFGEADN
jgi:hypothetical protein